MAQGKSPIAGNGLLLLPMENEIQVSGHVFKKMRKLFCGLILHVYSEVILQVVCRGQYRSAANNRSF